MKHNKDYDPDSAEVKACISQAIAVSTLASSPTNPRKVFDDPDMLDLCASVKQLGILQPILVRSWPANYPWEGDMPFYEVVAGERRFRAAQTVGLKFIPAMVRALSNAEVLEIQIIENLQRKDLHPLEEAEGYEVMMRDHGYTAEKLAERIGKSRSYIFGRMKLLDLDQDARRLFRQGLLNPSTALLVARIPTEGLRAKAIKEITTPDHSGDAMSVRRAQQYLRDRFMLELKDAPFPIDDETLDCASCSSCPKRTGNAPRDLFTDIDSPDVCTDPDCFQAKRLTFMTRQVAPMIEAGAKVVTGTEVKTIAPYGFSPYAPLIGHTRLEAVCHSDPENRTYREILGDSAIAETVLIENLSEAEFTHALPNDILAQKLKEAGIGDPKGVKAQAERNNESAQKEAEALIEKKFRQRLFRGIRSEVENLTRPESFQLSAEMGMGLFRMAVRRLFEEGVGGGDDLFQLWDIQETEGTENEYLLKERMKSFSDNDWWLFLVDLLGTEEMYVNYWSPETPENMLVMADIFKINAAAIRADLKVEETKDKKSEKKGTKKTPDSSADPLSPTQAAQADESLRAEEPKPTSVLDIGTRVRVKDDVRGPGGKRRKCCGQEGVIQSFEGIQLDGGTLTVRFQPGKNGYVSGLFHTDLEILPSATEAAQANDQNADEPRTTADAVTIETNETPTGNQAIVVDTSAGETPAAAIVETKKKPKAAKAKKAISTAKVL